MSLCVYVREDQCSDRVRVRRTYRSGLPISTYFSAMKLRWMISHYEHVSKAHDDDDLMFGTVESWIVYVSFVVSRRLCERLLYLCSV